MVLLRRAQIESVGLVIIVILLVFIGIIFLVLSLNTSQQQDINIKILDIKANNLRNALLKTDICDNVNLEKELESCAEGFSLCFNDCEQTKSKVRLLIEYSVKENYLFNVSSEINGEILILSRGNCVEKVTAVCQPLNFDVEVCANLC